MATFQELLKAKNKGIQNLQSNEVNFEATPAPIQNYEATPITVRCERVLDRKRLDLFFSAKPSKETRDLLHDQGFRCDIDRNYAWYHKDCLVNRMFLASTFDLPDLMQDVYNDDPKPMEETKIDLEDNPIWNSYKKQVLALQAHLKLDAADLMLRAIDCLYIQTFKEN